MDVQTIFTYLFATVIFVVPLYALYKCILNRNLSGKEKLLWGAAIIIIPFFGGLVYLLANKNS